MELAFLQVAAAAVIRRWQGSTLVVSRADIFEAIEMLGHKLADMPAPAKPARAIPSVLP